MGNLISIITRHITAPECLHYWSTYDYKKHTVCPFGVPSMQLSNKSPP